jgi:hypothetical protein
MFGIKYTGIFNMFNFLGSKKSFVVCLWCLLYIGTPGTKVE